jgi:hypothetical protein
LLAISQELAANLKIVLAWLSLVLGLAVLAQVSYFAHSRCKVFGTRSSESLHFRFPPRSSLLLNNL